eukprot:4448346-Amphidinium_carterae.2
MHLAALRSHVHLGHTTLQKRCKSCCLEKKSELYLTQSIAFAPQFGFTTCRFSFHRAQISQILFGKNMQPFHARMHMPAVLPTPSVLLFLLARQCHIACMSPLSLIIAQTSATTSCPGQAISFLQSSTWGH